MEVVEQGCGLLRQELQVAHKRVSTGLDHLHLNSLVLAIFFERQTVVVLLHIADHLVRLYVSPIELGCGRDQFALRVIPNADHLRRDIRGRCQRLDVVDSLAKQNLAQVQRTLDDEAHLLNG